MKDKKVVAILANFPASWIDPSLTPRAADFAPAMLAHVRDFMAESEEYEAHWIVFSHAVRFTGYRKIERWNQYFHIIPRYSLKWDQRTHYVYARWAAGRVLKRLKPDIIHAWGVEAEYAVAALKQKGVKILSMLGVISAIMERSPMGPHFQRQKKYERMALQHYDVITSESVWGCDRVREIVPTKPILRWEYAPDASCFEQTWEPSDAPSCILAGVDSPTKNINAAIQAFSAPELSHVTLYLAGVCPDARPNLPPNIRALGYLSRPEMLQYMRRSWCLVHPSFADTSPNVVKEARIIGLPIVVSKETGGTQYVVHGKSGYVIDPHDVDDLKKSVCLVVSSKEKALAMGKYHHAECVRMLSAETMRDRMREVYHFALKMNDKS